MNKFKGRETDKLFDYVYQFRSISQLCPTLCNTMDCSMTGIFVHHQLPQLAQTHGH